MTWLLSLSAWPFKVCVTKSVSYGMAPSSVWPHHCAQALFSMRHCSGFLLNHSRATVEIEEFLSPTLLIPFCSLCMNLTLRNGEEVLDCLLSSVEYFSTNSCGVMHRKLVWGLQCSILGIAKCQKLNTIFVRGWPSICWTGNTSGTLMRSKIW